MTDIFATIISTVLVFGVAMFIFIELLLLIFDKGDKDD